jgi:hypothetical protein
MTRAEVDALITSVVLSKTINLDHFSADELELMLPKLQSQGILDGSVTIHHLHPAVTKVPTDLIMLQVKALSEITISQDDSAKVLKAGDTGLFVIDNVVRGS